MPDISANNNLARVQTQGSTIVPNSGVATPTQAPISNISTQAQATTIATQAVTSKKESLSPWDDDLEPEELGQQKPAIIGSLKDMEPAPLAMPKNVEEKVGRKIPAGNFIQRILPAKKTEPAASVPQAAAAIPQSASATTIPRQQTVPQPLQPVASQNQKTNTSGANTEDDWDWFGSSTTKNPSLAAPTNQKISLNNVPGFDPATIPAPATAAISDINIPKTVPQNIAIPNVVAPINVVAPVQVNAANTALENQLPTNKKTSFSLLNIFKRKEPAESTQVPAAIQTMPVPEKNENTIGKTILSALGGLVLLTVLLIFLTESGIVSIGLENVYGAIGIEKLWGGLPEDAGSALGRAFVTIQNHPNYKVKGTLTLRVDSSVKSEIISPLVSMQDSQNRLAKTDILLAAPIKAKQAAEDVYTTAGDSTTSSNSSSASSNTTDNSSTSTTTSTGNSSSNSSTSSNSSSSTSTPENKTATNSGSSSSSSSGVSDIVLNVLLKANSSSESEAIITLNKTSGTQNITIVNSGENLYVRGDTDVKYGNGDSSAFTKYQISALNDKNITKDFFKAASGKDFSIKGERVGNEKVDGVRCYKYQIDSLEIGNALSDLGITSDFVQTVTGQIWIGVKDKEIRKTNLKITTPISSAVTMIQTDLEFYDFDVTNTPSYSSDIKSATAPAVSSSLTGDAKRKSDLKQILTALESYKKENGVYPVSTSLLKLNQSGNIIEMDLSKTLPTMPSDSKSGWFYAYQSDAAGSKCTLSARLENSSDSDGKSVNGIMLYYLYGN